LNAPVRLYLRGCLNDFFTLLRHSTLAGYQWQQPRLLLIAAVPLLYGLRRVLAHRRPQVTVALGPRAQSFDLVAQLRFVPDVVLGLGLALGIVAMALPQRTDERVQQVGRGIDLVLALDGGWCAKLQPPKAYA